MQQFVAYFRVSTARQGQSGLGLEAQRATARSFAQGRGEIIAEFTEVESGKKNDRPKLHEAIALATERGATLLIAKLDRLARNAGFIFALRDAGVDFVCCDLPEANTLTIGIFAVMAQHEREMISSRTKAALAARRARGLKLGTPENLTAEARHKADALRSTQALNKLTNKRAAELALLYKTQARADGKPYTLRDVAAALNANGHTTSKDQQFKAETVRRLLARDHQRAAQGEAA